MLSSVHVMGLPMGHHILLVTTSCWSHLYCCIQTSQWWTLRTQRSVLGTFLPVLGRHELCLPLELMWFSASVSSSQDRPLDDL